MAAALVGAGSHPALALCGDATGDGTFEHRTALAALRAAVSGVYDERVDVSPADAWDGAITAGDALAVLRASADSDVPLCVAANERVVASTV